MREKDFSSLSMKLPTRYVALGGTLTRYGHKLICVKRPPAKDLLPCEACRGCWFSKARTKDYVMNCADIQCSKWDRMDGRNVWFELACE